VSSWREWYLSPSTCGCPRLPAPISAPSIWTRGKPSVGSQLDKPLPVKSAKTRGRAEVMRTKFRFCSADSATPRAPCARPKHSIKAAYLSVHGCRRIPCPSKRPLPLRSKNSTFVAHWVQAIPGTDTFNHWQRAAAEILVGLDGANGSSSGSLP